MQPGRNIETTKCAACGHEVTQIDSKRVMLVQGDWVSYPCDNCNHIMRVHVSPLDRREKEPEEPLNKDA